MRSRRVILRDPATWLGLGAGLLNVNFLLEWLLAHHTPVAVTVVSDLAASGRPWNWAFRLGDAVSAVLLLALCALAWRAARTRSWRVATVLLALFAVSTLLAVAFPEHCTVSPGGPCPDTGTQSWGDLLHDAISTAGTTSGIVAAAAYAWATRERVRLAALHLAAFVLSGGLGLVFVTAQAAGASTLLGWTQRAQIVVLSAWYAVVGVSVAWRRTSLSSSTRRPDRIGA